jgi:hypothetical protein
MAARNLARSIPPPYAGVIAVTATDCDDKLFQGANRRNPHCARRPRRGLAAAGTGGGLPNRPITPARDSGQKGLIPNSGAVWPIPTSRFCRLGLPSSRVRPRHRRVIAWSYCLFWRGSRPEG